MEYSYKLKVDKNYKKFMVNQVGVYRFKIKEVQMGSEEYLFLGKGEGDY